MLEGLGLALDDRLQLVDLDLGTKQLFLELAVFGLQLLHVLGDDQQLFDVLLERGVLHLQHLLGVQQLVRLSVLAVQLPFQLLEALSELAEFLAGLGLALEQQLLRVLGLGDRPSQLTVHACQLLLVVLSLCRMFSLEILPLGRMVSLQDADLLLIVVDQLLDLLPGILLRLLHVIDLVTQLDYLACLLLDLQLLQLEAVLEGLDLGLKGGELGWGREFLF